MTLAQCWCTLEHDTESSKHEHKMELNHVCANCSDEEDIYSFTKFKGNYEETLIDDTP